MKGGKIIISYIESLSISNKDISRVVPIAFLSHWPAILCIIAITVLMSLDSGKDIVVGLMDVNSPEHIFIRIAMIFTGLIIYCSTIWLRPSLFFHYKHEESGMRRFLAVLPCFIVGAAILRAQFDLQLLNAVNIYWGLTFLLMLFLASILFREKVYHYINIRQITFVFGVTLIALVVAIYINKTQGTESIILSYHLFGLAISVLGVGLYHLFNKIDAELFYERDTDRFTAEKFYVAFYSLIAFSTAMFIAIFTYFDHINIFHPIFVFLLSFSFYLVIFNSINGIYDRKNYKKILLKNLVSFASFAVIFMGFAFPNFEHHKVDLVTQEGINSRASLDDHMDIWIETKVRPWLKDHPRQDFPLFLVSGEGGGSRAGYWFTRAMLAIDSTNNYQFRDHIYAISSVSGSSVGAGALLGFWEYHDQSLAEEKDVVVKNYAKRIFTQNYLSSSIFSVLIRDFFKQLFPFKGLVGKEDRNYWLQQEEAYFVEKALENQDVNTFEYLENPKYSKKEVGCEMLYRPYLSFYYNKDGSLRMDHPLVLTNATVVQYGKRAVVSPVTFQKDEFIDAFDVNGFIMDQNTDKGLSLGEACNVSELFPFFSATAILGDSLALGDGGFFENLGLTAIYEIKRKLKKKLSSPKYRDIQSRIDINVLTIRNSTYLLKRSAELKVRNQIYSPFDALYNSGIGGRTEYMFKYFELNMGENFHVIDLDHMGNQEEKLLLPLNRYLSEKAVNNMNSIWKKEDISMFEIE